MKKEIYNKIYGCFLGKSIGGSIGGPFEGKKEFLEIPYKLPEKILANDDLDLQIVWFDILRKKGIKISSEDLVKGWENIDYPFDEYGVAKANLKVGLRPPLSGIYNNWFCECMGAPIRSEIWACIFPARPEIAGYYSYLDASVDHWYDGAYGEIFLSVIESLAFVENDIEKLILESCRFLPEDSKVRKVSEMVLRLYKEGKELKETRDEVIKNFGHYNFTHCVQNIGFIISGLLYGNGDFLKTIIESVKCGYDTDCTGATSGAIIGIILGKEEIEKQIKTEIDKRIVPGWGIKNIYIPKDIEEFTEEILKVIEIAEKEKDLPGIEKPFKLPEIPEFEPPLKIKFGVSDVFELKEAEDIEKKIIEDRYYGFKEFVSDTIYLPLDKFFGDKKGLLFLKTDIKFDKKQKIKIYPATTDGVKLWLNKKLILSHHNHNKEFIPAPHRPSSPFVYVEIKEGKNEILIEIFKCKEKIEFALILADERNHLIYPITEPGLPMKETT
ncbi:MAG TPA: ADP-ribosylglycohydrolase family protein [bacterium]|nr:ADP-ribosylglycohydrolase family protein [bacterium]HOM26664.1 ADP-ribosylglycohydrolase family protein [bacterium]